SLLSNINSTDAVPTGLRDEEPLKITSTMLPPRKCLAELSPITQRTASMILDLPQPLGPTIAVKLPAIGITVGSTNDLNPESLIFSSFITGTMLLGLNGNNRVLLTISGLTSTFYFCFLSSIHDDTT